MRPAFGSIIINEFNSVGRDDFFELLTLKDNLDLRGLRVTDNELRRTRLNNGESVFTFSNDPYLAKVPRGTTIGVWVRGGPTDTVVNPSAGDWKLLLAPGAGVSVGNDGLGGRVRVGLSSEDQLYVYLPGPDGTSARRDNIYLDFISWDSDDDERAMTASAVSKSVQADADEADDGPKESETEESEIFDASESNQKRSGDGNGRSGDGANDGSEDSDSDGNNDRRNGRRNGFLDRNEIAGPAAYLSGSNCAALANEASRNWTSHTSGSTSAPSTPGAQNNNQDLTDCRAPAVEVPIVAPAIALGGLGIIGVAAIVARRRRRPTIVD
jgi:hypothetical protein